MNSKSQKERGVYDYQKQPVNCGRLLDVKPGRIPVQHGT